MPRMISISMLERTALLIVCLLFTPPLHAHQSANETQPATLLEEMRRLAVALLDGLGPELADQASFAMDSEERKLWSNLPSPIFTRDGVSFGEMTPTQRLLAHQLIQAPLSSQGYLKVSGIMRIDEILAELARSQRPGREPIFGQGRYWIGLFGDPRTPGRPWGWQLDGHHLALNFTVVGERFSATPVFLGAEPAEVRTGLDAGWYPLVKADQRGRNLFLSLDDEQRDKAVFSTEAPQDVITGPGRGDQLSKISGLAAAELRPEQRQLLLHLLLEYVGNLEPTLAEVEMTRLREAGFDELHFAWAGGEPGKPYYYRVHGPTVLIELDNNYPPGRNSGFVNHIHSVYRVPGTDYGDDLLRKHYLESPHHNPAAQNEPPRDRPDQDH